MIHVLALVACLRSRDATPEATVRGFVAAFNTRDWNGLFSRIEVAKVDEVVAGFAKLMSPQSSEPAFTIKAINLTETGDTASGPVSLGLMRGSTTTSTSDDEVHLHKVDGDWKIVDGKDPKGIFTELGTIGRNPSKMPAPGANRKTVIQSNMKIIGLGVLLYANDWDDKVGFNQSTMKAKLQPSLDHYKFHPWTAMDGTPLDVRINPAFVGKLLSKVADPAHCVMLTLGPREKLKYFDGVTPIVFVDRHVKYLSREALTTLKWR